MATTIRPEDIRRGDMFWYDFPVYADSRYERLLRNRHRVIVIQNNAITRSPRHDRVVVCPVSSCRPNHLKEDGTLKRPFQALLSPDDCVGDDVLDHDSIVHLEEMYTLMKDDCTERLCSITPAALRRVDAALIAQLDLANQLVAETLDVLDSEVQKITKEFDHNIRTWMSAFVSEFRENLRSTLGR